MLEKNAGMERSDCVKAKEMEVELMEGRTKERSNERRESRDGRRRE